VKLNNLHAFAWKLIKNILQYAAVNFALALGEGMNMERIKSAVNEYRKNVSEGGLPAL